MKAVYGLTFAAALLGLMSIALPGAADEIRCPGSITETPAVSGSNPQWTVVSSTGERSLDQVGVYLGAPSDRGAQVPDSTKRIKGREIVTWRIVRAPNDQFWIGCSYTGTTAMLFQPLDARVTECVAAYDLLASGSRLRLHSLDCR